MQDGFVGLALSGQGGAQVALRGGVVLGDIDGVGEEGDAVPPVTDLMRAGEEAGGQNDCGRKREGNPELEWIFGSRVKSRTGQGRREFAANGVEQSRNFPSDEHKQADGRDVSVAVGQRQIANLHQTDDRDECNDKPKPADDQRRMALCLASHHRANNQQQDRGGQHFRHRQVTRVRVKNRQLRGPKKFA